MDNKPKTGEPKTVPLKGAQTKTNLPTPVSAAKKNNTTGSSKVDRTNQSKNPPSAVIKNKNSATDSIKVDPTNLPKKPLASSIKSHIVTPSSSKVKMVNLSVSSTIPSKNNTNSLTTNTNQTNNAQTQRYGAKSIISVPAKKTEQKKTEILPGAAKENKQKEGDSLGGDKFEEFKKLMEKEREEFKAQLEKQEKEREELKAQLDEKQKKIEALESQNKATKDLQDSEPGTGEFFSKQATWFRLVPTEVSDYMKNSIINSADEDKMWWKLPDHIDNLLEQYTKLVISNEQIKNFVSIEERIKAISELHAQCNKITTDARNLLGISSLSLTESSKSGDEHIIENYFPVDIVEYLVDLIKSTSANELNLLDNTSELNHTRRIYCLLERYFRIQHFTCDCNVAFNVNHPVEGTLRPDLIGQFMKKTFLLEENKPEKCDMFNQHPDLKKMIFLMRYAFKELAAQLQLGLKELRVFGFLWGGCNLHVISMEGSPYEKDSSEKTKEISFNFILRHVITIDFKKSEEKPQLQFVRVLARIYYYLKSTLISAINNIPNSNLNLISFTPGKNTYGFNKPKKESKSDTKSSESTSNQSNNNNNNNNSDDQKKTKKKPIHQQLKKAQVIYNSNNNNEYRIIMLMGRSSTSTVFAAFDNNNNYVALKFVETGCPTDACLRVIGPPPEVAILQNLSHSNVIPLIDWWWTSSNLLFKETEGWTDGANTVYYVIVSPIYKKIPIHPSPPSVGVSRMRDLLITVEYLHNNGVYHGDIKPSNAMFTRDNLQKIVLIDFDGSRSSNNYVDTEIYVTRKYGTPGFRSPGQARQREDFKAADIWSIATTTLYWMGVRFNEERYSQSDSQIQLWFDKQLEQAFYNNPSNLFWDLIKKMMQVDPEKRISVNEAIQHPFWSERKNSFSTIDKENAHPNMLV